MTNIAVQPSDLIKGWRHWSDLHYPSDFELSVINDLLFSSETSSSTNADDKRFSKQFETLNLLEIGCGDGRVIRQFARHCKSCVGVDKNSEMIEFLNEEQSAALASFIEASGSAEGHSNQRVLNIAFEEMSATDLKFEDGSFDIVLVPWSLHQVPDKQKALQEAKRMLVSGGHLIVFGLGPGGEYEKIVESLRLDPGPQVDILATYETPLVKTFGKVVSAQAIGPQQGAKQFGFRFPNIEEALSAWHWALTNWHAHPPTESDMQFLEQELTDHQDPAGNVFLNIRGQAYHCTKS